ncbi:type II secretion system F family protein [Desulfuromonas sp. CSMB_57]|jgi:tight adherence protein C|uniref:type II secretion system F family protein n=1 Tax=Desulfuromonas sp. CSMB_57 TaxID=2807629 RepID=UPI001CD1EC97|nr:type II secretion system F family protein [Desulfuromonas sp. CSMB_57]
MLTIKNLFYLAVENMSYYAILALTFLAAFLVIFGIYYAFFRERTEEKRLEKLLPGRPGTLTEKPKLLESEPSSFVTRFLQPLNPIVSTNPNALENPNRLRLIQAGFRSNAAFYNFLAAKFILGIFIPLIYLITSLFFSFTLKNLLVLLLMFVIGFGLPDIILGFFLRARQARITRALPDALDLMVVCVEAGLGLDLTFRRVGEEMQPLCKDLSDEFNLTNLEIRAGKARPECFKNMATRTGVAEINNLMTILIQTSRFGTSLAKALRVHSDAMRIKRRQIAEERAAKSTVKLIFPLVFFIFPAIFVVLVGPGVIRIIQVLFPAMSGQ